MRGDITADEWRIAGGTARAYGADVVMSSSTIGLANPYPFRFQGTAGGVDLTRLPEAVPVPHVDSALAFEFDARGQFSEPFLAGRAWFQDSTFVGAAIEAGTMGTIDTSAQPIAYSGEGDVARLDVNRLGNALQVGRGCRIPGITPGLPGASGSRARRRQRDHAADRRRPSGPRRCLPRHVVGRRGRRRNPRWGSARMVRRPVRACRSLLRSLTSGSKQT